ncbi:MAG: hypothetical protein KAT48_05740, partial [Bacteroidales bacterium]|nr:hypothetical protein [Bacteroidales bacterium]
FVTTEAYTDNQWESLPDGGYRWAVEAVYSGATSEAALSNMLGKNWYSEVTINVALSSGNSPEGAQVILANEDGLPAHQYTAIVPASGVVVFPEVWNGTYDLLVMLFGYNLWEMLDFDITGDMTIDVLLLETTYPPSALSVDPLTLIATWLAPGVSLDLLDETWESGSFATNEWTFDPSQGNWNISTPGNPGLSAEFYWSPSIYNYSHSLVSKAFSGLGMPDIMLEWDLYLSNFSTATVENIDVEVYNGTDWVLIKHYDNQGGSIPWTHETFNITAHTQGVPDFKVRFRAWGADSYNINNYNIDNVLIYGEVEEDNRAVIGYNVYLDDAIAGFTTETWYQYPGALINWGQTYLSSVEAVYASGVSDPIYCIWTSEYLPPPTNLEGVDVGHTAYLTWGPPALGDNPADFGFSISDRKIDQPSPLAETNDDNPSTANTNSREIWDLQFSYDLQALTGALGNAGAETDGAYLYSTRWASNLLHKYTLDGTFVEQFSIPGVSGLRDLAFDGSYFYGGNAGNTIYQMDFFNKILVSTISTSAQVRSIAYDSDNDAFWVNNWGNILSLVDRTGAVIATMGPPPSMYGSAYDNFTEGGPFLWIHTGTSTGGGCQIEQMSIATGALTGVTHNVSGELGNSGIAGALWIQPNIVPGKLTLGGLAQGTPDMMFGYDMGDYSLAPDNLIAYNIYRDGSYLDQVDSATNEYYDEDLLAGWYSYSVTAVYGDPTPGESMHEGPIDLYIEGEGNIEGTVTQYGSQPVPIVGATVTATSEFDTYVTTTGSGGFYTLTDVNEGT